MNEIVKNAYERLLRAQEYFLRSTRQMLVFMKERYHEPNQPELLQAMEQIEALLLHSSPLSAEHGILHCSAEELLKYAEKIETVHIPIDTVDHPWVRIWVGRRKSLLSQCRMLAKYLIHNRKIEKRSILHLPIPNDIFPVLERAIKNCIEDYKVNGTRICINRKDYIKCEAEFGRIWGFNISLGRSVRRCGDFILVTGAENRDSYFKKRSTDKNIRMSSVSFSAIAPETITCGMQSLLYLVMYEDDYRSIVDRIINGYRENVLVSERGKIQIEEHTKVRVAITAQNSSIHFESEEDCGVWEGKYLTFQFLMQIPSDYAEKTVSLKLSVYFNGFLATTLNLVVRCNTVAPQVLRPIRHDITSAFVSYASKDIDEVSLLVQGMEKVRPDLDIFTAVDSLRSGENWEEKIQNEINQRDILYLCWSSNAKQSIWVDYEWRYMYRNRGYEYIDPIPLESPEFCPPPLELEKKHFNDRWIKYRKHYFNEFIRIKDCETGEITVLHKRSIVVGRTADADYQIKSPAVSSNHLRITVHSENNFKVSDMNSAYGTYVKRTNYAVGSDEIIIERGTEIVVGDRTIQIL